MIEGIGGGFSVSPGTGRGRVDEQAEITGRSKSEGVERNERLRQASEDIEGVFIGYLTRALRATVPDGGSPDAPGADMYGSLLDEHLAQSVANDTRTGIAEAIYRQLASRFTTSQGEGEG